MSIRALSRFFSLGLDDWTPPSIPLPPNPLLSLPPKMEKREEIFQLLSLQAHNIYADDRALRLDPPTFEKLRGDYPIRREPHALKVQASHLDMDLRDFISSLGYSLESGK